MKRAILPALALACLLAIPALSQEEAAEDELRVELDALKEQVEKQDARIKELEAYAAGVKAQSGKLQGKLKLAEKEGFVYPTPHVDAKKALLHGLQDFASVASGGAPEKRDDAE